MHSRFRTKGALFAALIALVIALVLPSDAHALPKPGAKPRGFRLFARTGSVLGALTGNRAYCGLNADGEVCDFDLDDECFDDNNARSSELRRQRRQAELD